MSQKFYTNGGIVYPTFKKNVLFESFAWPLDPQSITVCFRYWLEKKENENYKFKWE